MAIYLYKIDTNVGSIPMSEQLEFISGIELEQRVKTIGNQLVRLEYAEKRDGLWYLDFAKIRFNSGPGKASVDSPVVGFDMEEDEGFGEETAAIYNPASGYIAIQYNHIGMRFGTMSEYISTFNPDQFNGYTFGVCFDPDVEAKLARKEYYRKLHFSMNFGKITQAHRDNNIPLKDIINLENTFNAGSIEIIVRMPRGGNALNLATVRDAITYMRAVQEDDSKAVPKLQVYAGNDADATAEVLDLVKQRLVAEYSEPDLVLGQDKRYTRESRFNVIHRAMRGWQPYMER
ncbi:DUF6731 family protein [Chromobacterium violaceum]|uniref:DUF6731 family protein n=1 Tax=Chromobacterium violaceum TaxID=536 RepID=UPI00385E3C13